MRKDRTSAWIVCAIVVVGLQLLVLGGSAGVGTADEIHYSLVAPTSVAFDWRGTATDIQYGPSTSYGSTVIAQPPNPLPFSSSGPFREALLTGLDPGATYHYSIGGGP